MKKLIAVIIVFATLTALAGSALANEYYYVDYSNDCADCYVVATASVNVRTDPDLDAHILGSLDRGDMLYFWNCISYDYRGVAWYMVEYCGRSAWVSSRYSALMW